VFFLDAIRRAVAEGPEIVVLAAEARGLTPGAEVWVAGSPSGRVTRVLFDDPDGPAESRVVIHATLHWAAVPFLRSDARATISSSALLAPVVLKLDPGNPRNGPFDYADTLTVPDVRSTDHLLSLAREGREAVDSLTSLAAALSVKMAEGPGSAARLRGDTALIGRLQVMSERARAISVALKAEQAFPARVTADSLGPALAAVAGNLRGLRGEERAAEATGAVLDLAARLDRISENLDRLDRGLRAGRGTAGRAAYDDEIERQLAAFQARMDSLKAELRRDPGRWLRFSLF
jgi:phospholipid/cholesterol/gamma-HCH transport system substrate-binding protein